MDSAYQIETRERQLMNELGISGSHIAQETGLSIATVCSYVKGSGIKPFFKQGINQALVKIANKRIENAQELINKIQK